MTTTEKIRVDVDKATFEPGIILDGSMDSADNLNVAIAVFAEGVVTGRNFGEAARDVKASIAAHEAEANPDGDTIEDLYEVLNELAAEAVDALNDATPEGYCWIVEDNSLFLRPADEED